MYISLVPLHCWARMHDWHSTHVEAALTPHSEHSLCQCSHSGLCHGMTACRHLQPACSSSLNTCGAERHIHGQSIVGGIGVCSHSPSSSSFTFGVLEANVAQQTIDIKTVKLLTPSSCYHIIQLHEHRMLFASGCDVHMVLYNVTCTSQSVRLTVM